jgi:hypothetical protein
MMGEALVLLDCEPPSLTADQGTTKKKLWLAINRPGGQNKENKTQLLIIYTKSLAGWVDFHNSAHNIHQHSASFSSSRGIKIYRHSSANAHQVVSKHSSLFNLIQLCYLLKTTKATKGVHGFKVT